MRGGGLPGRAAELETAGGALDAVAVGERRLLTVLGEAGIGKTRLLAEIAEQARAARFVVIEGRATELERELPLVPVIDAAERYLGDADLLSRLPADRAALLNDLADGLGEAPAEQAPGGERWRLYRALAELLPLIAADRPLLLLIDDVHWADPATEELLSYLIRRPPGDSLLIALGLRPGPIADRIRGTERSSSAVGKVHLELRPLDRPAAEPILAAIPEPGDRERIFAASGGNPMLLEELVRGGGRGEVPNGVVAAVRGELEGLAREPRTLLEATAAASRSPMPWTPSTSSPAPGSSARPNGLASSAFATPWSAPRSTRVSAPAAAWPPTRRRPKRWRGSRPRFPPEPATSPWRRRRATMTPRRCSVRPRRRSARGRRR